MTPKSTMHIDPYEKGWMIIVEPSNLEEDISRLVKGDQAVDWLKKDIREVAKETVS